MCSALEKNTHLYRVLEKFADSYESGDFSELFSFFTEDCIYESQWVLTPLCGKKAVSEHLAKKGVSLIESGTFPSCTIVELVDGLPTIEANIHTDTGIHKNASVGLLYETGKLCLLMEQELDGEKNGVLLDLKLDDTGKVKRIDLCMPELFCYQPFSYCLQLFVGDENEMKEASEVMINDSYLTEFYTFMSIAGLDFDEYDDQLIPMEKWKLFLTVWEKFVHAGSFDEVFEEYAGVNYRESVIANQAIARQLGRNGMKLWLNRSNSKRLQRNLTEWTKQYCDDYRQVYICGY